MDGWTWLLEFAAQVASTYGYVEVEVTVVMYMLQNTLAASILASLAWRVVTVWGVYGCYKRRSLYIDKHVLRCEKERYLQFSFHSLGRRYDGIV